MPVGYTPRRHPRQTTRPHRSRCSHEQKGALLAATAAADSAASLSWWPGRAARLADASRSAAILTRSFLWAKDCANILSRPAAADPGPAAGFRHHGHSAGTLNFMRRVCRAARRERPRQCACGTISRQTRRALCQRATRGGFRQCNGFGYDTVEIRRTTVQRVQQSPLDQAAGIACNWRTSDALSRRSLRSAARRGHRPVRTAWWASNF